MKLKAWALLPGLAAFVRRQIDQELRDGRVRENREDIDTAFKRIRDLREAVENLETVIRSVETELKELKRKLDLPSPPPLPPTTGTG